MNMKFIRTWAMLALTLVIGLSVTGGTIAWFTDTVTSNGNEIKSGTLDLKLYAADSKVWNTTGFEYSENHEIKDGSPALFGSDILWEPGYTSAKYVKIENAGNLAFKYNLRVKPAMSIDFAEQDNLDAALKLAEVIEVYMAPVTSGQKFASFADIKEACGSNYVAPTLYQLINLSIMNSDPDKKIDIEDTPNPDPDGVAWGILLAEEPDDDEKSSLPSNTAVGAVEYVIALHMKESAGNEYQNLSVAEGFILDLRAEQYTYENDSFGNDYDSEATNDLPAAFVKALTEDDLAAIVEKYNLSGLDVGYLFATTEHPKIAEENPSYAEWHADFEVSFDRPVSNQIALAGYYKAFQDQWFAIPVNYVLSSLHEMGVIPTSDEIPANTPVRLLGQAAAAFWPSISNFSYKTLAGGVLDFYCGATALNDTADGITMTVSLNLYEPATDEINENRELETGNFVTLGTFQYTFGADDNTATN